MSKRATACLVLDYGEGRGPMPQTGDFGEKMDGTPARTVRSGWKAAPPFPCFGVVFLKV
jgi:hypothetical protein